MITYDPRYMKWDQWCALMAELFAPQQLGTLPEDKWVDWAAGMNGIGYFMESGVPDPRAFKTWQDWAAALCGILSITPQAQP
jgi:hypothetical protein